MRNAVMKYEKKNCFGKTKDGGGVKCWQGHYQEENEKVNLQYE